MEMQRIDHRVSSCLKIIAETALFGGAGEDAGTAGEKNDLGGEGKHAAQIPIAGGPLRRGGVARDHQPSIIEFGVKSTGVSYQLEESR